MAQTEDQVEQIVQAVLARLGGPARTDKELVLSERVVSVAALANRLNGVQRLIVMPRAVVTPSARDLLKEKNITLVRALNAPAPAMIDTKLALAVGGGVGDVNSLVGWLRGRRVEVEAISAADLAQAIRALAEAVTKHGRLGALLTDDVAAALCLANRHRGVRAAAAANRGEVNRANHSIAANFLIIDTLGRSMMQIQQIIETFVTAPPKECPTKLKPWLD